MFELRPDLSARGLAALDRAMQAAIDVGSWFKTAALELAQKEWPTFTHVSDSDGGTSDGWRWPGA